MSRGRAYRKIPSAISWASVREMSLLQTLLVSFCVVICAASVARSSSQPSTWCNLPPIRGPVHVILSTGRSGSSLLGKLMAAHSHTLYMFEPLRFLRRRPLDVPTSATDSHIASVRFAQLLNGSLPVSECEMLMADSFRKRDLLNGKRVNVPEKEVNVSTYASVFADSTIVKLIKVIRLTDLAEIAALLSSMSMTGVDLKLTLLYRDPRAIASSMLLTQGFFGRKNDASTLPSVTDLYGSLCENLTHSIHALHNFQHVPAVRYGCIQYEHIVGNMNASISSLLMRLRGSPGDSNVKVLTDLASGVCDREYWREQVRSKCVQHPYSIFRKDPTNEIKKWESGPYGKILAPKNCELPECQRWDVPIESS